MCDDWCMMNSLPLGLTTQSDENITLLGMIINEGLVEKLQKVCNVLEYRQMGATAKCVRLAFCLPVEVAWILDEAIVWKCRV